MSDITVSPLDAAIEVLRDRERDLDTQAQNLIIRRDEVRETINLLNSRKPRSPRKPRAVSEPGVVTTDTPAPFAFVPTFAREPEVEARDG